MLQEKIAADLKEAMKARDEARTSILRMVAAALKNKRIDLMKDLTDDDALKVVQTLVKQYKDSLGDFERGGRADLLEKTKSEIAILEVYLPTGPSEAEVRKAVEAKIAELGAKGPQDFGKVMGAAMKILGSGASGDVVSKVVKELLG